MNSHTIPRYTLSLITALACLLFILPLQAEEDDPMMGPMGMDCMGMGGMGMGPMMGGMGMGGMGMGPMMGGMRMGGMGMGMMGMQAMHMLDLSPKQRKALRDVHKDIRSEMLPLRDSMMEYRDQLYELYSQDKPEAKKIGEVYRQMFDVRRKMIELHIDARNRQYDVLNDEQKQQMKQMGTGWMGGYGGRRGMMQNNMMR